jgi:hypothetical protein
MPGAMGNFEELSRQLGYAFTQLENAQGRDKRRCLRKAHLLLLLADAMAEDAEATAPVVGENPRAATPRGNQDMPGTPSLVQVFAEGVAHSAERGSCRGLQTVLVLRKPANWSKIP